MKTRLPFLPLAAALSLLAGSAFAGITFLSSRFECGVATFDVNLIDVVEGVVPPPEFHSSGRSIEGVSATEDATTSTAGGTLSIVATGSASRGAELDHFVGHNSGFRIGFAVTGDSVPIKISGNFTSDRANDLPSGATVVLLSGIAFQKGLQGPAGVPCTFSFSANLRPGNYTLALGCSSFPNEHISYAINVSTPQPIRWIKTPGGAFATKENWDPAQVPIAGDTAIFSLSNRYTVSVGTQHTAKLIVKNGTPKFLSPSFTDTYTVDEPSRTDRSLIVTSNGTLTLDRGTLHSQHAVLGADVGAFGRVEVNEDGVWNSDGVLSIGEAGVGSLKIAGATVTSGEARIGDPTGRSRVDVLKGDTLKGHWTTGRLSVGFSGDGLLSIKDGSLVEVDEFLGGTGGFGETFVTGFGFAHAPSSLTARRMVLGDGTNLEQDGANLFISGGGMVTVEEALVVGAASFGNLSVTQFSSARRELESTLFAKGGISVGTTAPADAKGSVGVFRGGFIDCGANLAVGVVGKGELVVEGGVVSVINGIVVVGDGGGVGTVTVDHGGTLGIRNSDPLVTDLLIGAGTAFSGDMTVGGHAPPSIVTADTIQIGTLGAVPGGGTLGGRLDILPHGQVIAHSAVRSLINGVIGSGAILFDPVPPGPAPFAPAVRLVNASESGLFTAEERAAAQVVAADTTTPTLTTPKFTNEGLIALGATQNLKIEGDFEQGSTGEIVAEVAGNRPGKDQAQLKVSGTATLGGKLTLQFMNGFAPKAGQKFDFLAGSCAPTGDFSEIKVAGLTAGAQFQLALTNGIYTATSMTKATALPTVSLRAVTPKLFEKTLKAGAFTVSRTGSTAAPLTVNYSIAGTATPGSDYQTLSGSVIIPVKKKTATIVVTPLDDAVVELPETVELAILPAATYTHSKRSKAKLTIIDND